MSIARWNPKAVCGYSCAHGKPLTRRTGIAYEAVTRDEEAKIFEVRYLHGRCGCICGGYKWEGRAESGRGIGDAGHGETNVARTKAAPALMEAVVERSNMQRAYQRVVRNKGAGGVDGVGVSELGDLLRQHWPTIKAKLLETGPCRSSALIDWAWCRYWTRYCGSSVCNEPPYTEPYVRWCGRTAGVTQPPTRYPWETPGKEGFQPSKYDSPIPQFPRSLNHFPPPSPQIPHNPLFFLLIPKPDMTHHPPVSRNIRIISE